MSFKTYSMFHCLPIVACCPLVSFNFRGLKQCLNELCSSKILDYQIVGSNLKNPPSIIRCVEVGYLLKLSLASRYFVITDRNIHQIWKVTWHCGLYYYVKNNNVSSLFSGIRRKIVSFLKQMGDIYEIWRLRIIQNIEQL